MKPIRTLIAAMAVVLSQGVMPVMQAGAMPFSGLSRLKSEKPTQANRLRQPETPLKGKRTVPPLAFVKFCTRDAVNCAVQAGRLPERNGRVIASPAVLSGLITVNAHVNKDLRVKADGPGKDVWAIGDRAGDCEDFVLAKRARLLAQGWPSAGLAIAVVRTLQGKGHAVLVARTDAGDFVLDNLQSDIRLRERTDYRFVSMQDGSSRFGWLSL